LVLVCLSQAQGKKSLELHLPILKLLLPVKRPKHGYQGVVCGHIHRAEMREIDGVLYCNDGDWVESRTALVEHMDGRLEMLHWKPELEAPNTSCFDTDRMKIALITDAVAAASQWGCRRPW
jgi:hypothetical protein